MKTRTRKPAKRPDDVLPFESFPLTGTHCADCGSPQRMTPGGASCMNGHGGAPALEETRAALVIDPISGMPIPKIEIVSPTKTRAPIDVSPPVALWQEDDATPGTDGHEDLDAAWRRLFGEKLDTADATDVGGADDATFYVMPNGATAIASYPGGSMIQCEAADAERLRTEIEKRQRGAEEIAALDLAQRKRSTPVARDPRSENEKRSPAMARHFEGVTLFEVATTPLVQIDRWPAPAGLDVRGALVKLAPVIKSSERASFDAAAAKRSLLEAGAIAVALAPRVVPDGVVTSRRDAAIRRAAAPYDAISAWFETAAGLDDDQRAAATDAALAIYDSAVAAK